MAAVLSSRVSPEELPALGPSGRATLARRLVAGLAAVGLATTLGPSMPREAGATSIAQTFTLTKTADRATYSAEGEVITYTYVIAYDGIFFSIDFRILDDLIAGPFDCSPNTSFPPFDGFVFDGDTTTCTATYTVTAADMQNTEIRNEARACGLFPEIEDQRRTSSQADAPPCGEGELDSGPDDAVVTRAGGQGALTVEKSAEQPTFAFVGEQITYTYVVTNTGTAPITDPITVSDDKIPGGATCPENDGLAPGASLTCTAVYQITGEDIAAGSVTNIAVAQAGALSSSPDSATVQSAADNSSQIVGNFLGSRISMILNSNPDRPNLQGQNPDGLFQGGQPGQGGISGFAPFDFAMNGGGPGGRFDFSTSLAQIEAFVAGSDKVEEASRQGDPYVVLADLYIPEPPPEPLPRVRRPFDVWVEGHYAFNRTTGGGPVSTADLGVLYLGADYLFHPRLLAGVIAQFDWMSQTQTAPNGTVRGLGWMAGPYVSTRFGEHIFFDARVMGGTSQNTLTAPGIAGDAFSTARFLARANLSGNWSNDRWRFTPSLALAYMAEFQRAYVSGLGNPVPAQTVAIGRLTLAPEIGRRFVTSAGTVIEPHLAVGLQWDFARSGGVIPGGFGAGPPLRGLLQAGVHLQLPSGIKARLSGSWDGIGTATYTTFGAQLWISIPLN